MSKAELFNSLFEFAYMHACTMFVTVFRHKLLQNKNSELLKQVQSTVASSGVDDSKLAQELNNKNKQVEVLHEQIKT